MSEIPGQFISSNAMSTPLFDIRLSLFQFLPEEIKDHILSFLPQKQTASLAVLCPSWLDAVERKSWKHINIAPSSQATPHGRAISWTTSDSTGDLRVCIQRGVPIIRVWRNLDRALSRRPQRRVFIETIEFHPADLARKEMDSVFVDLPSLHQIHVRFDCCHNRECRNPFPMISVLRNIKSPHLDHLTISTTLDSSIRILCSLGSFKNVKYAWINSEIPDSGEERWDRNWSIATRRAQFESLTFLGLNGPVMPKFLAGILKIAPNLMALSLNYVADSIVTESDAFESISSSTSLRFVSCDTNATRFIFGNVWRHRNWWENLVFLRLSLDMGLGASSWVWEIGIAHPTLSMLGLHLKHGDIGHINYGLQGLTTGFIRDWFCSWLDDLPNLRYIFPGEFSFGTSGQPAGPPNQRMLKHALRVTTFCRDYETTLYHLRYDSHLFPEMEQLVGNDKPRWEEGTWWNPHTLPTTPTRPIARQTRQHDGRGRWKDLTYFMGHSLPFCLLDWVYHEIGADRHWTEGVRDATLPEHVWEVLLGWQEVVESVVYS